ncbi:MAG: hypothetical protein QME68_00165 [Elusimicrobiota bacterium]|nr:hypothetical protein [Elusimicrobiota bacterium]
MNIFIGTLSVKKSKKGEDYFVGSIGKIPIKGFYSKNDQNVINLSLDVERVDWLSKQTVKSPEKKEQGTDESL